MSDREQIASTQGDSGAGGNARIYGVSGQLDRASVSKADALIQLSYGRKSAHFALAPKRASRRANEATVRAAILDACTELHPTERATVAMLCDASGGVAVGVQLSGSALRSLTAFDAANPIAALRAALRKVRDGAWSESVTA